MQSKFSSGKESGFLDGISRSTWGDPTVLEQVKAHIPHVNILVWDVLSKHHTQSKFHVSADCHPGDSLLHKTWELNPPHGVFSLVEVANTIPREEGKRLLIVFRACKLQCRAPENIFSNAGTLQTVRCLEYITWKGEKSSVQELNVNIKFLCRWRLRKKKKINMKVPEWFQVKLQCIKTEVWRV